MTSFWNKIGLVDRNDFTMLYSEIEKLREDNRLMAEQNHQLIELLINQRCGEIKLLISSGIESVEKNINEETSFIEKCSVNEINEVVECGNKINNLERVIGKEGIQIRDSLSSELIKANEAITDASAEIKSDLTKIIGTQYNELLIIMDRVQNALNDAQQERENGTLLLEKEAQQICDLIGKEILKTAKTEELEKILLDMEQVRESLSNLWIVMKAIWVDSLLDDVEKSIE